MSWGYEGKTTHIPCLDGNTVAATLVRHGAETRTVTAQLGVSTLLMSPLCSARGREPQGGSQSSLDRVHTDRDGSGHSKILKKDKQALFSDDKCPILERGDK